MRVTQQEWKINNKTQTQAQVKELTASLKIQVDNLCVFLAQEKVASFAKTTPEEFLRITETACEVTILES
jgi:chromosome segregation ATPase